MAAPSIGLEQFVVRMPNGMRDRIKAAAAINRRSMNSEIVLHLERALRSENENGPAEAATSPSLGSNIPTQGNENEHFKS